jgi:uncharacterized protein (DUF1015 family)
MAGVFPFRGVLYRDLAGLARLTAPPYDIISPAQQRALYEASPHNIVRLEFGVHGDASSEDFYHRAGDTLRRWQDEDVLVRDGSPAFYVYRQTYTLPGQPARSRSAFLAEVQIEEFASGVIRPHEATFAGPKRDRLQLIRSCQANLSPIFGLYRDCPVVSAALQDASSGTPLADFVDALGVRQQMWRLDDRPTCERIASALADRSILIADGHHRYETALAYRDERYQTSRSHGWYDRVLFALVSMSDPGLSVLPTHRILHRVDPSALANWLAATGSTEIPADESSVSQALAQVDGKGSRFVVVTPAGCFLVILHPVGMDAVSRLDVSVLHHQLLSALTGSGDPHELEIEYTHEIGEALGAVRDGRAPAAVMMNATPVEEVDRVSAEGERMPEKSTYFYPKLSTGMVIRVGGDS